MGIIIVFAACIMATTICFAIGKIAAAKKDVTIYILAGLSLLIYIAVWITGVYHWFFIDCLLLFISVMAGRIFGGSIGSKQALMVFCITFSIIDILSFIFGPTSIILSKFGEGKTAILQYLAITVPINRQPIPLFGIGDTIIISSIYSSFFRMGLKGPWPYLIPLFGFLLSVAVGLIVGGIFALPFIGGATIIYLSIIKSS